MSVYPYPNVEGNLLQFSLSTRPLTAELVCVEVAGDVDAATAPQLREALLDLIARGKHQIAIDFSQVTYIDSTGMGALISAVRRVHEHDGRLLLVCPSVRIRRLFAIVGLNSVFDSFNTLEDLMAKVLLKGKL